MNDNDFYSCVICNGDYKDKGVYIRHLKSHLGTDEKNTILSTIADLKDSSVDKKNYKCDTCSKVYSYKASLCRHLKTCHTINNNSTDFTKMVQILKKEKPEELIKLRDYLNNLIPCNVAVDNSIIGDNNNNVNSNNQTVNNISISIKMMELGEENLEMLFEDEEFATDIIGLLEETFNEGYISENLILPSIESEKINQAVAKVYEKVNCNKDFPENHNLYVSNKKLHMPFQYYQGGKWHSDGNIKTLQQTAEKSKDHLISLINVLMKTTPEHKDILKGIKNAVLRHYNADQKLRKQIFTTSYNHKDMIGETFRKTNQKTISN